MRGISDTGELEGIFPVISLGLMCDRQERVVDRASISARLGFLSNESKRREKLRPYGEKLIERGKWILKNRLHLAPVRARIGAPVEPVSRRTKAARGWGLSRRRSSLASTVLPAADWPTRETISRWRMRKLT